MIPSKKASGVEGDEKNLSASDSTETLKAFPVPEPAEQSSDVRSRQDDAVYSSDSDSDDAEITVIAISPEQEYSKPAPLKHSDVPYLDTDKQTDRTYDSEETLKAFPAPEPAEQSSDVRSRQDDAVYSSDSDDGETTVIAISPKQEYSKPTPIKHSDVPYLDTDKQTDLTYDSEALIPAAEKLLRPSTAIKFEQAETCLMGETPIVPFLDLDDLRSITGIPTVTLRSTKGFTDLKDEDYTKLHSSGSYINEELKKIDSKNMLFFPSKSLTRPSVETIYSPNKKRSPSPLRRSSNSLTSSKTTTSLDNDKTKALNPALVDDTPASSTNKIEPKILPPLMNLDFSRKKFEKPRATSGKPMPFKPSGGKGIPSLQSLPKPKLGVLPSFIAKRKQELEASTSLHAAMVTVTGNSALKPCIRQETPRVTKTPSITKSLSNIRISSGTKATDDLFTRNRIPLRKHISRSTCNLIATSSQKKQKPKEKQETPVVKPKSVTFLLPEKESPKPKEPEIPEKPAYIDDCRRKFIDQFEKPPVFKEGPLPVTEPSPLYLAIKNNGWDYTLFTPKKPQYPVPTIPYNFLDQYLHIFDNNLERAAVHTKHGVVTLCTCEEVGDGPDFCEKHIDTGKLQYYHEVAQVMVYILSIRYEVPEFVQVEKMFQENYPNIYQGWILEQPLRLSMDYRVREAKCKSELVKACEKVLEEEDLLAEFQQSEEILGHRRDINISGHMKDVETDFEYSYSFLFKEYPHLFIQLVQKIEFMPLALERKTIATYRKVAVAKARWPLEELQAEEEYYRTRLEDPSN